MAWKNILGFLLWLEAKEETFRDIIDTIHNKVCGWGKIYLSLKGREVLLKVVVTILPNYAMQCNAML